MDLEKTVARLSITADAAPPPDPAPLRPCLVVTGSPVAGAIGEVFLLDGDEVVIGRDPEADLSLDDPGVSRRHARVSRRTGGGLFLTDLGSLNGTYANGVRIRTTTLCHGDRLQIGSSISLRYSTYAQPESSEIRLRQAMTAGGLGTWEWDARHGTLVLSPESERLLALGAPGAGLKGWELVHPADRQAVQAALSGSAEGGDPLRIECRMVTAGGSIRWVSFQGERFLDGLGRAARVAGTLQDVTTRKSVEGELRRQALMFESLSDGVAVLDLTGVIADWNSAAEDLFGWSREVVLGRRPEELFGPDGGAPPTDELVATARARGRWSHELRMTGSDGRQRRVEVVAVPLADGGGEPLGVVVMHRDVGERKLLEARLQIAERMGALGTLASGIAHEINNPLSYVMSNVEYARQQLMAPAQKPDGNAAAEIQRALADAFVGADRIRSLVRDLRAFSYVEVERPATRVRLDEVVEFALRVTTNEVRHRARVTKLLGAVPPILADEGKLGQVVINLLVNAAQAIEEGAAGRNEIRVVTRRDDGGRVVLEISDSGHGIPAELQNRIFDPFFTTRRVGEGVGLGLSICHAFVDAAGGTIAVESEGGRGTTFRLTFPAADEVSPPAGVTASPAPGSARLRVLAVDDDPLVAGCLRRDLSERHDVTVADSGAQALTLFRAGARFDAIVCDVMMPEMSGVELQRRLADLSEDQSSRVIFITGGAFGESTARALEASPNRTISKPWSRGELERAIAVVADAAGRAPG